jgi:hypothetical protein
MRLENFAEWFAIRPKHSDEGEHHPGRLTFDLNEGISLETIWFSDSGTNLDAPLVSGQTLTGWLDYQRPATLIQPWVQSSGGGAIGVDTPVRRERQRFVASALIKNVFLDDIRATIFTGLVVEHPALHAWVNPRLVKNDWLETEGADFHALSVDVQQPQKRTFKLDDGTQAEVTSMTRTPRSENITLEETTVLRLKFSKPVDFDAITRIAWRISALFEFLIGARVRAPVYRLPTTSKRLWNQEEREVIAEYWYCPISRKKRHDTLPETHRRLMVEKKSSVSLERMLNHITGSNDELIFLADQIQSVEDYDLSITQGYLELLGGLEAFDEKAFGSGADPNFKSQMKNLKELVAKQGSNEDKAFFNRIAGSASNKFSLLKRLERLHLMWSQDGFRRAPDLGRIRDLRNIVPHGRGLEISSEIATEMISFLSYLTALGRYHVLKVLGFTGDQIASAFLSQAHRYGMFVPEKMIPSDGVDSKPEVGD